MNLDNQRKTLSEGQKPLHCSATSPWKCEEDAPDLSFVLRHAGGSYSDGRLCETFLGRFLALVRSSLEETSGGWTERKKGRIPFACPGRKKRGCG